CVASRCRVIDSEHTFSFSSSLPPPDLHSFPTRRSSDLIDPSPGIPRRPHISFSEGGGQAYDPDGVVEWAAACGPWATPVYRGGVDRKSTRLNSSHRTISYAVFCLKKKNNITKPKTHRNR